MNDYIFLGGFGLIVIMLIFYIFAKDSETNRKFHLYEKALEEINKKLYELEEIVSQNIDRGVEKRLKIYIDNVLKENIEDISHYIASKNSEHIQELQKIKQEIYEKIEQVDKKIKGITLLPEEYHSNDKKIVELYQKGMSASEIARNLRIGIGEVELVLKIEGIR